MRLVSRIVSVAFHPVFVNAFCLLSLFTLYPSLASGLNTKVKEFLFLFIFLSTAIVPLLSVFIMRLSGNITNIQLPGANDRNLPYLITLLMYLFCFYQLQKYSISSVLPYYLLACSSVMATVFAFNFFKKISIHMATLGVWSAIILFAYFAGSNEIRIYLALVLLISGLTASARLYLEAHTRFEVYTGYGIGFVLTSVVFMFYYAW